MKLIKNILLNRQAWLVLTMFGLVAVANADKVDPAASVSGKYSELKQTIYCPEDAKKYGEFKEYGFRAGENWCGYPNISGYLVWVNPNWYLWRKKARTTGRSSMPYVPGYDSNDKKKKGRDCRPVHMGVVIVNPC